MAGSALSMEEPVSSERRTLLSTPRSTIMRRFEVWRHNIAPGWSKKVEPASSRITLEKRHSPQGLLSRPCPWRRARRRRRTCRGRPPETCRTFDHTKLGQSGNSTRHSIALRPQAAAIMQLRAAPPAERSEDGNKINPAERSNIQDAQAPSMHEMRRGLAAARLDGAWHSNSRPMGANLNGAGGRNRTDTPCGTRF